MKSKYYGSLSDRISATGHAFPIDVMPQAEATTFRARIEALESGPIGYGLPAQRLYRFKPYLIFKWAAELVRHPGVLRAVEQVIGPDIMVWAVGLFIKEPHDPTVIRWHQDGFHMDLSDNDQAVRAWIALTQTHVANGAMSFITGSHLVGFIPHAEDDQSKHIALRGEHIRDPLGADSAVPVCLAPGQLSLHHMQTIHGSPGNNTPDRRMTVAMTFVPPHVRPLSGRDTATLVHGADRHGNWIEEPARPRREYDLDCADIHRQSMDIRLAAYHGSVLPEP